MSKPYLTFSGKNTKSHIILTAEDNSSFYDSGSLTIAGNAGFEEDPLTLSGFIESISATNEAYLSVLCHRPMTDINASSGAIIDFNNAFLGEKNPVNVTLNKGTLNITGENVCLGTVTLGPNSSISFDHGNRHYNLSSPDNFKDSDVWVIENMELMLGTCEFLNENFSEEMQSVSVDWIHHLKTYNLNQETVSILLQQNNMVNSARIDSFIEQNFLLLTGITKDNNLPGSLFEGAGQNNIIEKICSYLDFSDVSWNNAAEHADTQTDIIGDNT